MEKISKVFDSLNKSELELSNAISEFNDLKDPGFCNFANYLTPEIKSSRVTPNDSGRNIQEI